MAKAQQTFADMLAEMDALKQRIAEEADSRVKEIKEELDSIAEAKGVSIGQLLGLPEARTTAANNTSSSNADKSGDAAKAERTRLTGEIKAKYDGRTALAHQDNGAKKDYEIGLKNRGAVPNWVVEAYSNGDLEKYLSDAESAPGEVTPDTK